MLSTVASNIGLFFDNLDSFVLYHSVFPDNVSGTKSIKTSFFPAKLVCFKNSTTSWVEFSGGQHHTVCMDAEGNLKVLNLQFKYTNHSA